MTFKELGVAQPILKALEHAKYTVPTPIQEQAIPPILAGRDVLGCAQTGTGKTAAFAVPTLQRLMAADSASQGHTGSHHDLTLRPADRLHTPHGLHPVRPGTSRPIRKIRTLVLTPTRELALQIHESFSRYGRHTGLKSCVIFGGVSQRNQEIELRQGVDILVATPGRLNDLIGQRLVELKDIEILTLDEADRMLDMGFIHDVKKILARTPDQKQTLFFSATMPPEITHLSNALLDHPVKVSITPESPTVEAIDQTLYLVDKADKRLLLAHLLQDDSIESALVFTRTKHGADRVAKDLNRVQINAMAIHGNKSQNARQAALAQFKDRTTRVLVATDIAARGLDISGLSHVFNFDLPEVPESYVHRIGRTGRAGRSGIAISFCDTEERKLLVQIEKLCGRRILVVADHPFPPNQSVTDEKPFVTPVRQSRPAHPARSANSTRPGRSSSPARPANQTDRPATAQTSRPQRPIPSQSARPSASQPSRPGRVVQSASPTAVTGGLKQGPNELQRPQDRSRPRTGDHYRTF